MKKLLLTGIACTLLAGPVVAVETSDEQGEKPTCAWSRYINSYKMVDDKTVILEQSPGKRYKATLSNRCRDLKFSIRIAVDSHDSCLRRGDALIVRSGGDFTTRCYIDDIVLLPKEEAGQSGEESKSEKPE
jgi:hypothetical protein